MEFEYLDAALLHLQGKVVVILLGFVNPDDIVEKQIVTVAGSQPLMSQ
jgi:starvation-inducible outer membrane lipoprotein